MTHNIRRNWVLQMGENHFCIIEYETNRPTRRGWKKMRCIALIEHEPGMKPMRVSTKEPGTKLIVKRWYYAFPSFQLAEARVAARNLAKALEAAWPLHFLIKGYPPKAKRSRDEGANPPKF